MAAIRMISPCVPYLDMVGAANALAPRPGTLNGKVLGLVPNWRPAAGAMAQGRRRPSQGALWSERSHHRTTGDVSPRWRVAANCSTACASRLDALCARVDVAMTATGD